MNMHHITKSLFVGAAIAGIGMSSGKAELEVSKSLQNEILNVVKGRLEECYRQVRAVVPNIYTEDWWKVYQQDDTNVVYNLIVDQSLGFFHFCSLPYKPFQSRYELKKYLKRFFEVQCPPYKQKVKFSNKKIERHALILFRTLSSITGDGYGWDKELENCRGKCDLVQRGIVDKGGYGCCSVRHSFVFNDEFIESIAGIVHNGMTVVNKMCEITQDADLGNDLLKAYLGSVQDLYMRYLVIKNSRRGNNTITECNRFIGKAEQLGRYDRRMSSYGSKDGCTSCYLSRDEFDNERVNRAFCNAVVEIGKWKKEIETIRDDEEMRPFSDPYWFKPKISEQQKVDALQELEDDDKSSNAFLEEID